MKIIDFIFNLFKESVKVVSNVISSNRKLSIGDDVDVVYLGGCMDTEIRRVPGIVKAVTESYVERHYISQGGDVQHYQYEILTDENELIKTHSSWLYFNKSISKWEVRH